MICVFDPIRYRKQYAPLLLGSFCCTVAACGLTAVVARTPAPRATVDLLFLFLVICLAETVVLGIQYLWRGHNLKLSSVEISADSIRYTRRIIGDQIPDSYRSRTGWKVYTIQQIETATLNRGNLRIHGTVLCAHLDEDKNFKKQRSLQQVTIPLVFSHQDELLKKSGLIL